MGKLTMRQLIFDLCGGLKEGRQLKGCGPRWQLDARFES